VTVSTRCPAAPIISVITPVYAPSTAHLIEAYESIRAQDMPQGWNWEWLVQEDGTTGDVRALLPPDPRISPGEARHTAPAIARNMALARARGTYVKNLDADDLLTPGVLARDIAALSDHPEVDWTTSAVLDLLEDGSTQAFDFDPPPGGPLEPGSVIAHWIAHDYRSSVHPTTLCMRTRLAYALGGWMALPGLENVGLLMAASAISRGWFHPEPGLYYRRWSGQRTALPVHTDPVERDARRRLIRGRAEALHDLWNAQAALRRCDMTD
jgi:glycosyltransferase involved in cell wall biosynthesis